VGGAALALEAMALRDDGDDLHFHLRIQAPVRGGKAGQQPQRHRGAEGADAQRAAGDASRA
jgi:hypothetical protein